eukprot:14977130-Alexandrium_andersonii.AAC.1
MPATLAVASVGSRRTRRTPRLAAYAAYAASRPGPGPGSSPLLPTRHGRRSGRRIAPPLAVVAALAG